MSGGVARAVEARPRRASGQRRRSGLDMPGVPAGLDREACLLALHAPGIVEGEGETRVGLQAVGAHQSFSAMWTGQVHSPSERRWPSSSRAMK